MGSIMDSRYWTCPHCCTQFDWNNKTRGPDSHDAEKCRKRKVALHAKPEIDGTTIKAAG